MSMPFYVSPEQLMKDRADYARKGIARGRSMVVIQYADGLLLVAENRSQALHKISEIYDRIAFAAVGRYNEFENLRIAGVRLADMRGYSYDRRDVTGRGLANAYAQTLGTIFSSGGEKPYEVEIFVAEVGDSVETDQVYRLTYEGSVADEHGYAAMGGSADIVTEVLRASYEPGLALDTALQMVVDALGNDGTDKRAITGDQLEAAVLDRTRPQARKFRRIPVRRLIELFGQGTMNGSTDPTEDRSSDQTASSAVSSRTEGAAGSSSGGRAADPPAGGDAAGNQAGGDAAGNQTGGDAAGNQTGGDAAGNQTGKEPGSSAAPDESAPEPLP